MYCGTETTYAPDSIAMWRMLASQPSESSAVGATQSCGPPGRQRQRASGIRFSQQIKPSDPADGRLRDGEVIARADAVEEALVLGRHQLPVLREEPRRAEREHRVVERPGPFRSRSFTPTTTCSSRSRHTSRSRSTMGPGTSTLFSQSRSQNSSQPPNDDAPRAHAFDG